MNSSSISIGELLDLRSEFQASAAFGVLRPTQASQRVQVFIADSSKIDLSSLWAIPHERCGESPTQFHPKFLMALLASLPIQTRNPATQNMEEWQIPAIEFETEESTRLSMTLNGMRMSTEYFASGSPRVLQLVQQRLQAGQADVVHDILVYLMQRALELSTAFAQERGQLAESIAAYLGLNQTRVEELLAALLADELWGNCQLESAPLALQIENRKIGTPRANINIAALIQNQAARFNDEATHLQAQHERVLQLIDEVVQRLLAAC